MKERQSILNAKVVKEVRTTMKDLESKVATANNISKTSVHSGNDARLKSKTLVYSKEITRLEKKIQECIR